MKNPEAAKIGFCVESLSQNHVLASLSFVKPVDSPRVQGKLVLRSSSAAIFHPCTSERGGVQEGPSLKDVKLRKETPIQAVVTGSKEHGREDPLGAWFLTSRSWFNTQSERLSLYVTQKYQVSWIILLRISDTQAELYYEHLTVTPSRGLDSKWTNCQALLPFCSMWWVCARRLCKHGHLLCIGQRRASLLKGLRSWFGCLSN